MAVKTVVIKCPFCNQHLGDTKQEWIICTFCGKRFKRAEIQKAKEEEMRRNLILDLNDEIKKEKTGKKIGYTIGGLFFVFAMALQFMQVFEIIEWLLFIIMIVIGLVWIGFGVKNANKFKENQSKLFDLTGGREMFDYY
jgi:hypothetical protein